MKKTHWRPRFTLSSPSATMTTEPTETEALLKKDASASPEPNAKSARVGGYVKAGLALAGVLGVCALGKAFEGNLVDAYRVAVGGNAARLAGHARPAHHYISHSNRPGGLFNTCEGKCPAVSVDFDAVTHEPGHAADRAAHLYLIGDTTDRLWHDGFCNDMLTSTERCPYRCAMPEPAALPGNVVPYMCDDPSADTCAAETAGNAKCCESKWMPNGAKAYQCCVTTSQATTATACRPRHYATGGGTAGFLHVLGASAEGELGQAYFSAKGEFIFGYFGYFWLFLVILVWAMVLTSCFLYRFTRPAPARRVRVVQRGDGDARQDRARAPRVRPLEPTRRRGATADRHHDPEQRAGDVA